MDRVVNRVTQKVTVVIIVHNPNQGTVLLTLLTKFHDPPSTLNPKPTQYPYKDP